MCTFKVDSILIFTAMKEELLHFIWKNKLFFTTQLYTSDFTELHIQSVGLTNLNSGPDFFNAKIQIGEQLWAGTVEIHLKASDWYAHNHEIDANYDAVILHVVWEEDVAVFGVDNQKIPTLELNKYVSKQLLNNYNRLFLKDRKWIFCENDIVTVESFTMNNWLERLYIERLESKATEILLLLEESKFNWEAVLFQLLCKNFGLKVNADAFFQMACSLDFGIVKKEQQDVFRLESLFFGELGMLNENSEGKYAQALRKEYKFQSKKYRLRSIGLSSVQYFRLRPANFPTIRISQLANLFSMYQNVFSKLMALENREDFYQFFGVSTSKFWNTHYTFDKESKPRVKKLTKSYIDLLIINTIIPLKFLYLKHIGTLDVPEFLQLVKELKPEKNGIIDQFSKLNLPCSNAFETQALLQLKNEYCNHKKCLQCAVGNKLLRN
jgi:hypothetical protein